MDFLIIFLVYVVVFGAVSLLILFSDASPLLSRFVEGAVRKGSQVIEAFVPHSVTRTASQAIHYVFYTRNHVLQSVFGLLVLGGHAIFIVDILPLLYTFEPDHHHARLPLVLMFANLTAFHLSCTTDPGRVTATNAAVLASVYPADGVLYREGAVCSTCQTLKPPRSKHCSFCNRCVHRFDHHCIWTNNCVAAGNLRYFLLYLATLEVMVINGAVTGLRALHLMVVNLRMMEASVADPRTGEVTPITVPVLVQHLFMQYPRCVFLASSLAMLAVLLGLFVGYHFFLAMTNQTTNERYKMASVKANSRANHSPLPHSNRELLSKEVAVKEKLSSEERGTSLDDRNRNRKSNAKKNENRNRLCKELDNLSLTNSKQKSNKTNSVNCIGDAGLISTNNNNKKYQFRMGRRLYDRGVLHNLKEIILPWSEYEQLLPKSGNNQPFDGKRNKSRVKT